MSILKTIRYYIRKIISSILHKIKTKYFLIVYRNNEVEFNSITVFIPVHQKDLKNLEKTLLFLHANCLNKIVQIFVVGNLQVINSLLIENLLRKYSCLKIIDENQLLGVDDLSIEFKNIDLCRFGWIYQQLLKLKCVNIANTQNILIWDSDLLLLKPKAFVNNNIPKLFFSQEFIDPYRQWVENFFERNNVKQSFVCHHIVIQKSIFRELENYCFSKFGLGLMDKIIQDCIDSKSFNMVSEYNLYAYYIIFNKLPHTIEGFVCKTVNSNKKNVDKLGSDFVQLANWVV